MKLRRVELPAFGCLRDFQAELAPGLNLFFGVNEAGKSTLQQALCALLYGFYEHDRARPDETARQERFRPWPANGGFGDMPYRGVLEYELEDGRRYEVRRDFTTADVPTQLIDVTTGIDIASQLGRGRHGNVPFARRHLGMPRGVFQSCAFITQGDVFRVTEAASPREIGDAVAALADSGRRDVSAATAIARLDAFLARIGSERARTAELPRAREELRRATAELEALDTDRALLAEKCARLEQLQRRRERLAGDVLRTEFLLLRGGAAETERRLSQLREADAVLAHTQAVQDRLRDHAGIPGHLRDEVLTLRGRRSRALESLAQTRGEREAAARGVSESERLEYEALSVSAGALTEEQLPVLEAAAYQAPGRRGIVVVAAALLRAVGGVVRWLMSRLRRRPSEGQGRRDTATGRISPEEAQALLERHRRFLQLRPAVEALQAAERRVQSEEGALAGIEADLRAVLVPVCRGGDADIDALLAAFAQVWCGRQEYQAAIASAEEAERRRVALLGGRSSAELPARLQEQRERLAALLAADPGLERHETGAGVDELSRTLAALQQQRQEVAVAAGALGEEVRVTLERHRPRAAIEEEAERWRRRVARLEQERSAAQLARSAIEEAMVSVYRDFAPAVNAFLSEGIEAVTDGRYRRAHVDPATLRISLLLPETGQVVTNPPVSHGTWTVAYVLMRIGLAQHMSAIGEAVPLVLDDPFVDVDSERLPRVLDFLLGLSARPQVLLFTKDEAAARWFEERASGGPHALLHLSAQKLAAPAL